MELSARAFGLSILLPTFSTATSVSFSVRSDAIHARFNWQNEFLREHCRDLRTVYKTAFGVRVIHPPVHSFIRPSFSQLFVTSSKLFKSHRGGKIREREKEKEPRREDGNTKKREARNFARTFLRRCQRLRVTVRCFYDSAPALPLKEKATAFGIPLGAISDVRRRSRYPHNFALLENRESFLLDGLAARVGGVEFGQRNHERSTSDLLQSLFTILIRSYRSSRVSERISRCPRKTCNYIYVCIQT